MLFSIVCRKVVVYSRYTHIIGKKYARLVDTRFYNAIFFFRTIIIHAHAGKSYTYQKKEHHSESVDFWIKEVR